MTRTRFLAAIPIAAFGWFSAKRAPRLVEVADIKDNEARWREGKESIAKRVVLDGRDVSRICYRAERYSDGSGRCFCHMKRDGKYVLQRKTNNGDLETRKEVLVGRHIEITTTDEWEPLTAAESQTIIL